MYFCNRRKLSFREHQRIAGCRQGWCSPVGGVKYQRTGTALRIPAGHGTDGPLSAVPWIYRRRGGGVYTKNSLCMTYLPPDWKSREPGGTKALPQVGRRRWEMKNQLRAGGSGVPEGSSAARQGEVLAQDSQPQHPHSSLLWPRVWGSIPRGNGDLQELLARGIPVLGDSTEQEPPLLFPHWFQWRLLLKFIWSPFL